MFKKIKELIKDWLDTDEDYVFPKEAFDETDDIASYFSFTTQSDIELWKKVKDLFTN
jgi:hypothetical protein